MKKTLLLLASIMACVSAQAAAPVPFKPAQKHWTPQTEAAPLPFAPVTTTALIMPLSPLKPVDRIGGADNTTQTIAHCGYLPMSASLYTSTPLNVRIIQSKLSKLGFYRGPTNGRYDSASRAAVRAFQADYGMPADGVVGPTTAQRIAYASHPLANVRRCGYVVASGR